MSHIISRHDMIALIGRRFQALGTIHSGLLFDLTREESAMRDGIEAEDIHRFRVEIKKLRAFLRLVKPGQRHVLPTHLREYYRSLGAIRNLQLQELRLLDAATDDLRRLPVYSGLLRSQLSVALRQANGLASDVLLPHAQSRALEDLPAELGTETIRDFLWKASTGIQSLMAPDAMLTDRNMHELRKILKDLNYNQKYVAHESAHILPPALTAGKEKIEPLLVLLGR